MIDFLRSILIGLALHLYWVAEMLFSVFFALAGGELISPDKYELLVKNFYVILGIVMLFIVSFSLLRSMVNPDDQKKGTESVKKIIINLITSSVILLLLPSIFGFAFNVQKSVLNDWNVFGKFFGFESNSDINSGENTSVTSAAYSITNNIYTAFFNVNEDNCGDKTIEECQKDISPNNGKIIIKNGESLTNFKEVIDHVDKNGNPRLYMNFSEAWGRKQIEYNLLLSILCGLLLLWSIASFCIDMATRLIKLCFYQIIAPLPLFFRVIPDSKLSGTFNQWVKVTLTCYLEVYIRIIVIYFVVFLCTKFDIPTAPGGSIIANNIIKALVYVGLITFMRQAPKLISEVTGIDSGNMKLGIKDKLAAGGAFTAGAIIGGGLTSGIRNLTNAGANVANKFKKGEDGKLHLNEGVRKRDIAYGILGGLASTVAGGVSGATRSGKAGMNAKSFGDMKNSAATGAKKAIDARDKRATYKANHGENLGGVIKGHATDAIRGAKEWAGIGVVTSAEADYFTGGANAFDAAHSQMESAYKGKPEHNKIKEKITELNSEYSAVTQQIKKLEDFNGPLTEEQTQQLASLQSKLSVLKNEILEQETFKSQHEAKEMTKKLSLQMEAINGLVNAKMKYFDMSSVIFGGKSGEELYGLLKDVNGNTDSKEIQNLISKIKQNQTISMEDLRDSSGNIKIDLNSLEKFVDKVGIKAKDMAAEKRVEVAHAKALKEESKGDKK